MSGLEIVGVVLGSIPLATALGQYADGVSTIKAMVKYENVFLDLQVQLMLSMTLFRQTCELLLRGLALPDAQFRDLVEYHIGWDNNELAEALRQRLGNEDFGTFQRALERVHKRLALMGRKLRLRDDLTPPFMQGNVADEERRKDFFASWRYRIAGGFNAAKHQRNCSDIYGDVRQLHEIIQGALSLETGRHDRSPLVHLGATRSHAHRIHHTLRAKWHPTCPSHTHRAKLRLHLPGSTETSQKLRLSFSFDHDKSQGLRNLCWRDATVIWAQAPAPAPAPAPSMDTSRLPPQLSVGNKKTHFAIPDIRVADNGESHHIACSHTDEIIDLCNIFCQHQSAECLGFLKTEEWCYHIHDTQSPVAKTLLPLQEVFRRKNRVALSTKERYTFALTLAGAVLQLYDTPWLGRNWNLGDIYLHSEEASAIYVTEVFDSRLHTQDEHTTKSIPLVKNETLFALGIALLELAYSTTLSALQTPEDAGKGDFWTQYLIADRLTKEVQMNETPRYANAVAKCLHPNSDTYDYELSNDGFRKRFFNDVVQPLKEDFQLLFPPKP